MDKIKKSKKIIIWSTEVIKLIEGKPIGGIAVQMYFWARVFRSNGWEVFSFIENEKRQKEAEGIVFQPQKNVKRVNMLLEWWYAFINMITLKPDVIIFRGANRELLPLSFFSNIFKIKLVMFGASDVNFEPGKELVGSNINRKLYHRALKRISFFVVQNKHQHDTLSEYFFKDSLILYNIWGEVKKQVEEKVPTSDAVWVANFRRLKRAEWVIDAAIKCPDYHFVMAGGKSNEYFDEMKNKAERAWNLDFLGPKPFFYANQLVKNSKVLLCTSTFEGFPNTFLQAWSNGIPVISTVDPSNIIKDYKLGVIVNTEDELVSAIQTLLSDTNYYLHLSRSITTFFDENHSAQSAYNKLIKYIYG